MPNNSDNCIEKVCIQGKRVFDACVKQSNLTQITINTDDAVPANPTLPLTFVSCRSNTSVGTVSNLIVERLADRPNYGRVQADIGVPVDVTYIDANNVEGTSKGSITIAVDVVMYLPQPSVIPYTIEATVSAIAPDGNYSKESVIDDEAFYVFTLDCCVSTVIKVCMDVDLIVPSYGYAVIPPCQEYTEEVCNGYFDLPLYPTGRNN